MTTNNKRVLILSHAPFDRTSNLGRTLTELFLDYPQEDMACLCFGGGHYEFDVCNRYFTISDSSAFKSVFNRFRDAGEVIIEETHKSNDRRFDKSKKISHKSRIRGSLANPFMRRVKDVMWRMSHFDTKRLYRFIDDFKPEVIFYMPGEYIFTMQLIAKLQKKYQIPVVCFCVDDFYRYNIFGHFSTLYYHSYRRAYRKMLKSCSHIFYISQNYITVYKELLGVDGELLFVPSELSKTDQKPEHPKDIVFLGNISLGRYLSIIDIAKTLYQIDDSYQIYIHTGIVNKKIVKALNGLPNVHLKRMIPYSDANKKIADSGMTINCESFKKKYCKRVWGSFSTKIPDLLALNTPILSYGPKGQYSIDYMKENNIWFVAQNSDELRNRLIAFVAGLYDEEELKRNAEQALKNNHDNHINRQKLYDALQKN